jgi:uncharacterized membrane protein YhaH (DUF805 family)
MLLVQNNPASYLIVSLFSSIFFLIILFYGLIVQLMIQQKTTRLSVEDNSKISPVFISLLFLLFKLLHGIRANMCSSFSNDPL